MELRFENQPSTSKWSFGFEMKPRFQNGWNLDFKMELNPCMEIIIQKINFLKNENCSCSFFKFWNMDLNFTFRFFEMRVLISIWVSIKIETKFEFMKVGCDVGELLSEWLMFVLYYVWF